MGLPVENHRVDESEGIDSWWHRLLKKLAGWFQGTSSRVETIDELQQLRERRKIERTVRLCGTILLNEQSLFHSAESKRSNVLEFRQRGEEPNDKRQSE